MFRSIRVPFWAPQTPGGLRKWKTRSSKVLAAAGWSGGGGPFLSRSFYLVLGLLAPKSEAEAMMRDCDILLLDEPTNHLDCGLGTKIRESS